MRKLTKALAAVLLLAIVVSAFAMFSTFAAEGSAAESNAAKTIYDMDAQTSITVSNQKTNAAGQTVPRFVKETDGGQSVWNFDWRDTKKGENPATGQFWAVGGLGTAVTIHDDAGIEGSRDPKDKNTDYFIMDFDIASDSILAQKIYFNVRQYASGKEFANGNSITNSDGSECPQVGMDANGRIYVSNGDGSNTRYATFDSEEKWTHVTFVYDIHTAADGTITNKAYAYINGYYVGTINSFDANAAYIYFIRVQQSNGLPADGANVKYSNFTVKTLPAGYTGTITKSGVLGSTLYSLHNIPELAYCMQDLPESPENYKGQKIADIQRGDETIPVYDVDDLHGDLLDGDVVTVYKDVSALKKYYAVKMISQPTGDVDAETGEPIMADVPANVVWQDINGVELGAEGSLFKAPNVLNVASSSAWAIIVNNAISKQGGQSSYSGSGNSAVIYDPMWHALAKTGTQEVILFEDYTGYGRSYGITGSTSSSTKENTSGSIVFDLNGYTFENAAKRAHYITIKGAVTTHFKNGGLTHAGGGMNLVMVAQGYTGINVYIDNCNVNIPSGTIFDQRAGVVVYHNSNVTAKAALSNTKGVGDDTANFVVDNCDVSTTGVLVNLAQTNSSGVGRYGSGNMCAAISNSSITSSNYIIDGDIYANQGHTAAEYIANVVNHNIRFIDSDIATTSTLLASDVSAIPKTGENVLDANVNVDIYGCSISANRLSYIYRGSTDKTLVDYLQNIDIENSKLNISSSFGQGYSKGKMAAELVINIADGCMFTDIPANGDGIVTAEVKISDDSKWAYTSAEGYKYIITSAYGTYTYQLGNKAAETFYWNQAEGEQVDINKVVTTAETALYKYTWANEGNAYTANMVSKLALSAKSNLTLCDYIYFNLFINKAEYDAAIAAGATVSGITVDENTEIINIDGTDYYKLQIKDIKLEDADKAVMTVGVSFAGAYDDSYASEKIFSVLGYAENILNKSTDEKSVALIESLLNYIVAACNYASVDASAVADKAAALIDGKEFGAIAGEAKAEALEGVEVAIRYGNVLYLGVKANAGDVITVSYTSADDNAVSITKTADENGEIYVAVKAYDFASDLTITRGADSATMNIQGYYNALADDAAAQAMVEAIYNYATAAAAYKATMA